MSVFDTSVTDGATANLFHVFASSARVKYKEDGLAPVALSAIVGEEKTERIRVGGDIQVRRIVPITITTDPNGPFGGVAVPRTNARIELDGRDYAITAVEDRVGNQVTVKIVLPAPAELSHGSRRDRQTR